MHTISPTPKLVTDEQIPSFKALADALHEFDCKLGRGGLFIDEAVELAKLLEADGVDTFHVGQANHTGNLNDTIPAMGTRPECFMAPYARRDAAEDRGGRRRPGRSGDRRVHRPRRLRGHHRRDDGADRRRGVAFDTAALEEHGIKVTLVGDCNGKAADINRAVEEGYLAATAA